MSESAISWKVRLTEVGNGQLGQSYSFMLFCGDDRYSLLCSPTIAWLSACLSTTSCPAKRTQQFPRNLDISCCIPAAPKSTAT